MFPYEQEDYFRFGFVADQWLVEYAHQCAGVISLPVMTFSMSLVFELYLKAYYAKIITQPPATTLGHNVRKILENLAKADQNFPSELIFNKDLLQYPLFELDKDGWKSQWFVNLGEADKKELKVNYEFYLIMAYGIDLKYGISPSLEKHNGRLISSAWTLFNPKLSEIIIAIRNRISYPGTKTEDILSIKLKNPRLEQGSKDYLQSIIDNTIYK